MIKKLKIKESVNLMSDASYDKIAILGYACTLAANDLHHIHLCAVGNDFQEIHDTADNYLAIMRTLNDFCLEVAREGGIETENETYALDILKDAGYDWQVSNGSSYNFTEAFEEMQLILSDICECISNVRDTDEVTYDVASVLDKYLRDLTQAVNYFIEMKLTTDDILTDEK